ncbi:SGNH/GDSL hydrolase family protein [Micromonospora fulviviridis]|uniref:SGNH/GDSL hydrolase family protein n=1 Tax=Micromonospora fulviviridis TaxID=47860 RepID=UPI0037B0BA97
MASRLFPDSGSRYLLRPDGSQASNGVIVYYLDAAAQNRATVYVDRGTTSPAPGDAIVNSQTHLDAYGGQLDFRGPTDDTDVLYATVDGGPVIRIPAAPEPRLRALEAAVGSAASTAYVDAAVAPAATAGQRAAIAAFSPLKRALDAAGQSIAVQVLGDSTGNDGDEWPALFAQQLATAYPTWSVQRRLWSDTDQAYAAPVAVSTGTAGARYLDCSTGTATRQLPASASPNLSGVIDVRIKATLSDWTPAAQAILVGRSGAAGTRGWYFLINTAGVPAFVYSTDGTALVTRFATVPASITDGSTSWVRAVFTPDDGAGNHTVSFWKSTDGITWTQIGTTVTTAGAVTLFNPASIGYEVGGNAGGVAPVQPRIHEVWISAGGSSPTIVPPMPEHWPRINANSAQIVGAPVLTIVNGSMPGAGITGAGYLSDATRLPKMTTNYGQVLTILSTSHNDTNRTGLNWVQAYDTWRAAVQAQLPMAPLVMIAQNPETPAATWAVEHAQRRADLTAYARAQRLPLIDVYAAFTAVTGWETSHMLDSIHPNPTGSTLWAAQVKAAFDAANPAY